MKIIRIFMTIALFGVAFSCSISEDYALANANSDFTEDSRGTSSLPSTKKITVNKRTTLYLLPENIDSTLEGIRNGEKVYYYSDANYEGTLYSTNYEVTGAPYQDGRVIVFKLSITYSGTVTLKAPQTKEVTKIVRGVYVSVDPDNVFEELQQIPKGSMQTYYSDSKYSGFIRSTSYQVVDAPTHNGHTLTFKLDITYKGTVHLK